MKTIFRLLFVFYAFNNTSAFPPDTTQIPPLLYQAQQDFNNQQYSLAQQKAQTFLTQAPHSPQALHLLGQCAQKQYDHPLAIDYFRQALQHQRQQSPIDSASIAQVYYDLGISHKNTSQYPQAVMAYEQAIQWSQSMAVLAGRANNSKANVHRRLGEFAQAIHHFEEALRIYAPLYESPHVRYGIVYINMGLTYENWDAYEEADRYYQQALEEFKATVGEEHAYTILVYQNLGNLYYHQGDLPRALDFHGQALREGRKVFGEGHPRMADIYGDMGLAYASQGDHQQALAHYQEALAIKEVHFSDNPDAMSYAYQNLAEVYVSLDDYPQAYFYYQQTLKALKAVFGAKHPKLAYSYRSLGQTYALDGQFSKAIAALETARDMHQVIYGLEHPETAEDIHQLAKAFALQGDAQMALSYFEQAIVAFGLTEQQELPFERVRQHKDLLLTLMDKAQFLDMRFRENSAPESLKQSIETWQQALTLLQYMRKTRPGMLSKAQLTIDFYPLFEGGIQSQLKAYDLWNEPRYIQEAWTIAEASKSFLLLDALNSSRAKRFAGIPDSLLRQEKILIQSLNRLAEQKAEKEALAEEARPSLMDSLNQIIFQEQNALIALRQQLESQFPNYYRLKYQHPLPQLDELQQQLAKDEALIEYFLGDSTLYVFVIHPDQIVAQQIELSQPLDQLVQQLRQGIFSYPYAEEKNLTLYEEAHQNYREAATQLYDLLLRPLSGLPEQLVIVPDSWLWSVPFETLLGSKDHSRFKEAPYALLEHQFSYNFSATLWMEMQEKQVQAKGLLAMAPSFSSDLPVLAHNGAEAEYICDQRKGTLLLGEQATRSRFLELAPQYSQLHLASHAIINEQANDFSYLAFSDSDSTGWKLYIRDLYNLQVPAELVVLSACETGLGTLQKGEAMASLSRGFTYAGAKSLLTSLWQVNDLSTTQIMADFYDYLNEGNTKDEALRKAKIDYIKTQKDDRLASPFYWGAFVAMGDMEALPLPSYRHWWLAIGGLGLLFFLLLIRKRFS